MTVDDNRDFTQRLAALAEVFDVKLSAARIALYFETLREFALADVVRALNHAAKTNKFFPRPAELRDTIVGDSEDAVEMAWVGFRQAIRRLGYMTSVVVQDAALAESILALFGSWDAACAADLSPEMWASRRKEFGRVYRAMLQRRLEGARYLIGMSERHNGGRPEWAAYSPVGVIGRDGEVKALSTKEAEVERTRIAAQAHEFSRLEAGAMWSALNAHQKDGAA